MTDGTGPEPGEADLQVRPEELTRIGEAARGLGGDLVGKGLGASDSSYTAASTLLGSGLDSGAGLRHTMARFFRKTMDLKEDCDRIDEHLTGTVRSHSALEHDLLGQLRTARAPALPTAGGNPAIDALLRE
ncbi:hypothetical protein [Streptomyces marincola]|uniref:Uncharacterized protein n=1 Tax=Streptomyces marincola TaxID=2878388 RepID=A0A1W7CTV5_9ACTN|nr:hypothetical protein [Streptomyces marincola]ARQ68198.1 hypothetical protein CAG99_04490 [Streptomyces marincola]